MWHFVPVELCWERQQAPFKTAGKVQQLRTTAQSWATGTENEAAWAAAPMKGGCELSRKGREQHPWSLDALWD